MRLEQSPSFRRVIIPWYDGDGICKCMIALMLAVLVFAAVGVSVANGEPDFAPYAWVPLLLLCMSLGVLISTSLRLLRRRRARTEAYDEYE